MPDVMPQIAAPTGSDFYDFEADPELELGRPVADWGADDLFDHAPRRRSRKALAARERRVSGPMPVRRYEGPDLPEESPVRPAQARPAVEAASERPALHLVPDPAPEPAGRRTVTITGRPGALAHTERRRPPRTVEERIGHRPDRVAGWAFGMGMLLILIAVSTADAAPL